MAAQRTVPLHANRRSLDSGAKRKRACARDDNSCGERPCGATEVDEPESGLRAVAAISSRHLAVRTPCRLPVAAFLHVEQAQPRHAMLLQQALVNVLLLQLRDLRRAHLTAIGRQIAVGIGAYLVHGFVGRCGEQCGE